MVPLKQMIGGLGVAALTTLASIVAPSGAAATTFNYLSNGSFETGNFAGWTQGGNLEYTQVVTGAWYQVYAGAENGAYYAAVGPVGSTGTLSQTFSDLSGQSLNVSGWFAAICDYPSDLSVLFDGTTLFSVTDPNTHGVWTNLSFDVIGTGSDTLTLVFRDDPGYIALDNFSVTDPPAAPLPGALPLFAGGLGMMGLFGWRRKRQAVMIASQSH